MIIKSFETAAALLVAGLIFTFPLSVLRAQVSPAPATNPPGQETPAAAGGGELQRILVTGTLIPTAETETALPMTTYDSAALRATGSTALSDFVRYIPSDFGASGNQAQNFFSNTRVAEVALGSSTIDLRGLGDRYTLTLVNGVRVGALRDVGLIPQNFVDRIDILKDGASSRYGSDAVGGVVNILLRKALPKGEYAEFDVAYQNTTSGDAGALNVTALGSYRDDKEAIIAGYDYYHRNALFARDRFITSNSDTRRLGGADERSSIFPGSIFVPTGTGTAQYTTVNPFVNPASGADYRLDLGTASPYDEYNLFRDVPTMPSYERNSAYASLEYTVDPTWLHLTGTFLYTRSQFKSEFASVPDSDIAFGGATNSPYYPLFADVLGPSPTVNYRSFELGPRVQLWTNEVYLFQTGASGQLPSFNEKVYSPIQWEVNFSSEENGATEYHKGGYRDAVLSQELLSGEFNPFVSIYGPRQGTLVVGGVPYSYNNAAALGQAAYDETERFPQTLRVIDVDLHTTLLPDLPQGGLTLAAGYEYRWETLGSYYGPYSLAGDVPGFNAVSFNFLDRSETGAIFGEGLLPLITPEMKIPGIYSFDVGAAVRYERTSQSGPDPRTNGEGFVVSHFHQTVPKVTLRYQPIQDVTLRASYSEAFRTPDLNDQFLAQEISFPEIFNPGTGRIEEPSNGVIVGGNPDLKPETARLYTAGIVWSPKFVPGTLTLSADYYGIYQKNLVLMGDPQPIIQAYFSQGLFSNLISFNPDGSFNQINAVALNVASRDVEGLDLSLVYQTPRFEWGQLTLNTEWNYTLKYKVQYSAGAPVTNYLGRYSDPGNGDLSPGAIPYWKGYVDLAYQLGGFGAGLRVNYVGGYWDDPNAIQVSPPERKVREYTTLDLRISYEIKRPEPIAADNRLTASYGKDGKEITAPPGTYGKPSWWSRLLGGTTIQAGVNNVFDTEPPFSAGAAASQFTTYDTSLYDIRDRVWYVSLRKVF